MTAVSPATVRPFERKVPPVVPIAMTALTLAIISGIVVVGQIGKEPALTLPAVFVIAAVILELVAVALAVTIRPFAWSLFLKVFKWTLLAYVLQSAIIQWAFIINDVPGRPLAVLTTGIVVFATVVPLMIAFTAARYQQVDADQFAGSVTSDRR